MGRAAPNRGADSSRLGLVTLLLAAATLFLGTPQRLHLEASLPRREGGRRRSRPAPWQGGGCLGRMAGRACGLLGGAARKAARGSGGKKKAKSSKVIDSPSHSKKELVMETDDKQQLGVLSGEKEMKNRHDKNQTSTLLEDAGVFSEIASNFQNIMQVQGPEVVGVVLYPNGTAAETFVDTSPKTMPDQYERILGGRQATIVGQMHPSDVVMLGLETQTGQDYNTHQPLPGAHQRNVHGSILCLRMDKDDAEPRNYTMAEHLDFMERYRKEYAQRSDISGLPYDNSDYESFDSDEREEGDDTHEEYYDDEDDQPDPDDDEDYDYDSDEYEYDDAEYDGEDKRGGGRRTRLRKPQGLAQRSISRRFQEKYGRLPDAGELAEAMEKMGLDENHEDEDARMSVSREDGQSGSYYSSYYSDEEQTSSVATGVERDDGTEYDDEEEYSSSYTGEESESDSRSSKSTDSEYTDDEGSSNEFVDEKSYSGEPEEEDEDDDEDADLSTDVKEARQVIRDYPEYKNQMDQEVRDLEGYRGYGQAH